MQQQPVEPRNPQPPQRVIGLLPNLCVDVGTAVRQRRQFRDDLPPGDADFTESRLAFAVSHGGVERGHPRCGGTGEDGARIVAAHLTGSIGDPVTQAELRRAQGEP